MKRISIVICMLAFTGCAGYVAGDGWAVVPADQSKKIKECRDVEVERTRKVSRNRKKKTYHWGKECRVCQHGRSWWERGVLI